MSRKLIKFDQKHMAVGYWSSPWRRIELEQTPAKVRVWLQDKLTARGRLCELYLPVDASTPGVVACTCVKDTTQSADRACLSCHGTLRAPGYLKFLHESHFWCSAEDSSFVLTNTSVSTTKKANVIILNDGATSGTVVTQDKPYTNPNALDWELKLEAFIRAAGETATLEFSKDLGITWTTLALTDVPNPGTGFTSTIGGSSLNGTGVVRFRVTLTRLSASDLTPAFEIVRLRRALSENTNKSIRRQRPDYQDGKILILRPWVQEIQQLEAGRGLITDHVADRTWTAPLDFFDQSLMNDTPPCRVVETTGPHPFYIFSSGIQAGTRYAILKAYYNDNFGASAGLFTHQYFDDRRLQAEESTALVW